MSRSLADRTQPARRLGNDAHAWWSHERCISIPEARDRIYALIGTRPHRATVFRWLSPRGVRHVVLESFYLNGRRFTTGEALIRFVKHLNHSEKKTQVPRSKQITAATAKLRVLLAGRRR